MFGIEFAIIFEFYIAFLSTYIYIFFFHLVCITFLYVVLSSNILNNDIVNPFQSNQTQSFLHHTNVILLITEL